MATDTNTSPLGFFLGHALSVLGSDAAFYYGNQLSQDTPDSELALYQGTQNGYALQAAQNAALRNGQPAVAATTTLNSNTLIVLAVIAAVVLLAVKK